MNRANVSKKFVGAAFNNWSISPTSAKECAKWNHKQKVCRMLAVS